MSVYSAEDYPIGVTEIATLLDVKKATVSQWLQRNVLPKPDASVNGGRTKIWKMQTIVKWANATGRNNRKATIDFSGHFHDRNRKYWRYDTFVTEPSNQWVVSPTKTDGLGDYTREEE